MEKRQDLRVQKTYRALTETFLLLLEKKPFEKITVDELCTCAMVRRATFYKHFADKYAFFTFFVAQISEKFLAENRFAENDPTGYLVGVIRSFVDFLDERERLIETTKKSNMFLLMVDMISEAVAARMETELRAAAKAGLSLPAEPEILSQLFAGALLSGVKWWITQKNRLPKERFIEQLSSALLTYYAMFASPPAAL